MSLHLVFTFYVFFFFNDTATTEIYTLSLHDALPIFLEIGEPPVREHHHPRQRARVLVDVGLLGAAQERQIAGLERLVDLLDRNAGRDHAHPEKVGEGRAIRRIERREAPLLRRRDGVSDGGRLLEIPEPQRVLAEHMIEPVDETEIRPVIADAD